MGKKKSQKKGEASKSQQQPQSQQQTQQPAQPAPQQPQPSSSTGPGTSQPAPGQGKGKKAQKAQKQPLPPEQLPVSRQEPSERRRDSERSTSSQPQQQQTQKPAEGPPGAWQKSGPQQQQRGFSDVQGRGGGRGQPVQQQQQFRPGIPQQQKQPTSPHSSSPSPQPDQSARGQPGQQQYRQRTPQQQQEQFRPRTPQQQQQQPFRPRTPQQQQPIAPHSPSPQPGQGAWGQPAQQQQFRPRTPQQQPVAPHSPSPQPGQTAWGQPRPQSPRHPQQFRAAGPPPGFQSAQYQQPSPEQVAQQFQQVHIQPETSQHQPQPPRGFSPSQQQQQVQAPPPSQQPQGPQQTKTTQKQKGPQQKQQPKQQPQSAPQTTPQQPQAGKQQKEPSPQKPAAPAPTTSVATTYTPEKQADANVVNLPIPRRKKLNSAGTAGRKIMIETNHLALAIRKLETAIHYDVVIDPDKPKKLLRAVVEEFRLQNYPNRYPAFDGSRNLFSFSRLPFGNVITGDVTITADDRPKTYNVTIKFASQVDLSGLSRYFQANLAAESSGSIHAGDGNWHMIVPQDAIQVLDVVLRSAPALNCIPVGRSFFTQPRNTIINLGDGMEMYYGFYQSAILGWKPFLNVDVAHKAFPKNVNVVELIKELRPRANLAEGLFRNDYEVVDKFMRTLKVQYEIPRHPTSRRIMRVNQLDKSAIEARFRTENNEELTVEEYFRLNKGYNLRYPKLPCLWVGSRTRDSKILFPAELCIVLEGQVTNRAMTANQTSEMIKVAATTTTVRKEKILQSIRAARYNQDPRAIEFGISVSEDFAKIPARILDAPTLKYYEKDGVKPERGAWRAKKFQNARALNQWAVICVDERTRPPALQEFAEMMIQQGRPLGMAISRPQSISPIRLTYRREKQELEREFDKLRGMELILVVISEDKDIYNFVKQAAELTVGTLTQCVKGKNVFRPKPSTVGNILLKINAKLNGVNHSLEVRPPCLNKPCMIMGADVTHPSPENKGTVPSVAAVTASHDPAAFQYNICWRLQPPTQEIITDLANIVKEHLLFFYTKNRAKPERIIFFRDGVSEGQFQTVLNAEVKTIRQACTMVQKDGSYKPKITFLVVQKRHHTRFFPTNKNDSEDRNFNVPAGTVVDTEITHPTALDFYLVSHASIQGVARPTKYRMLWDDSDMNEDELERLTYHLCHMFTRCTRSVSYPAPTYYAHLAAARAKVYCERRHINMNDLQREQEQLVIKPEVRKDLPMFFV